MYAKTSSNVLKGTRMTKEVPKQEQSEPKEWISLTDEEIEKEWFKTFSPEPGIGKNVTNGIYEFANAILKKAQSK